jgi:hypothetical protein
VSPEVAQWIRDAVACDLCKAPRGHRCRNHHGMPMSHVHQVRVLADLFKQTHTEGTAA